MKSVLFSSPKVTWTFGDGTARMQAQGLPYHSYGNNNNPNTPVAQNWDFVYALRAGTNAEGSNTPATGIIGFMLNGVALKSCATSYAPKFTTNNYSGYRYISSKIVGDFLNYTFYQDNAGGYVEPDNIYSYNDLSFVTAWQDGSGHISGNFGTAGVSDLSQIPYYSGSLFSSDGHSKILGFALDGYPIYGNNGYTLYGDSTSTVKQLKSGYVLNSGRYNQNSPSTSVIPLGALAEDYTYNGNGDLDIHNGRFCVTPEYPQGTYAYFATQNYPFFVGPTYFGDPVSITNQTYIDGAGFEPFSVLYSYPASDPRSFSNPEENSYESMMEQYNNYSSFLFNSAAVTANPDQARALIQSAIQYLELAIAEQNQITDLSQLQAQPEGANVVENAIENYGKYINSSIINANTKKDYFGANLTSPDSTVIFTSNSYGVQGINSSSTQYLYPVATQGTGLIVNIIWNAITGAQYYKITMQDAGKNTTTSTAYSTNTFIAAKTTGVALITVTAFDGNNNAIVSQPTTITVTGTAVTIPDLTGKSYSQALTIVQGLGLTFSFTTTTSNNVIYQPYNSTGGYVNTQSPVPGTYYNAQSISLNVIVYSTPTATVPNLIGLTLSNAQIALANVGLSLGNQIGTSTGNSTLDQVIWAQAVASGSNVAGGTSIDVNYNYYTAPSVTPSVNPVGVSPVGVGVSPGTVPYVALGYTDTGSNIQLQWSTAGGPNAITNPSFGGSLAPYVNSSVNNGSSGTAYVDSPYGQSGNLYVTITTSYGSATSNSVNYTNYHGVGVSPGVVSPGVVSPGVVSPGVVSPGVVSPGVVSPVSPYVYYCYSNPPYISPVSPNPVGVSPVSPYVYYCYSNPPYISPVSPAVSPKVSPAVSPVYYCFVISPVSPKVSPVGVSPVGVSPKVSPAVSPRVSPGAGCLIYGTMVTLSNGEVTPIERVKIGQEIKTANIPTYPNGEDFSKWYPGDVWSTDNYKDISLGTTKIVSVRHIVEPYFYKINQYFGATGEHFIFAKRNDKWQFFRTRELKEGDSLYKIDGSIEIISKIEKIDKMTMVVDIDVEPNDLFFGDNILVHNLKM